MKASLSAAAKCQMVPALGPMYDHEVDGYPFEAPPNLWKSIRKVLALALFASVVMAIPGIAWLAIAPSAPEAGEAVVVPEVGKTAFFAEEKPPVDAGQADLKWLARQAARKYADLTAEERARFFSESLKMTPEEKSRWFLEAATRTAH